MSPHSPFLLTLARSQFTTKSLFESVQVRVVLVVVRMRGLRSRSVLVAEKACIYLPILNLTAVLPFPNRSYATPIRGVTSCQWTPWVDREGYRMSTGADAVYPGP